MKKIFLALLVALAASVCQANSVIPLSHKDAMDWFAAKGGTVEKLDDGTHAVRVTRESRNHWQRGWEGTVRDIDVIAYIDNVSIIEVDGVPIDDARLVNIATERELTALVINSAELSDTSMELVAQLCPSLTKLALQGSRVQGAHFAALARLPALRELDVRGAPLEARYLRILWRLNSLRRLVLADTTVGDPDVAELTPLKQLEYLDLSGTAVTDAGISLLRDLPALTHLELARTAVEARVPLGRMPLRYLGLARTAIDDDSLPVLGTLWDLKNLDLSYTKVTDKGMAKMRTLALHGLRLEGVPLSSAGLVYLSDMPQLERLFLDGVQGHQLAALQRLRKVQDLTLRNSQIELVRLSGMPALRRLEISGEVFALELNEMDGMRELELEDCKIRTIELSVLPELRVARLPGHHYNLPSPDAERLVQSPLPEIVSVKMRKVGVSTLRIAARIDQLDLIDMPGLHHLDVAFSKIRELSLDVDHLTHLRVGGQTVAALPTDFFFAQSSLTNVFLWGPSITDSHLAEVAKSETLRGVHLRQASVTQHGVRFLRWIPTLSGVYADEYYVQLNGLPDFEEGEFAAPFLIQNDDQIAAAWPTPWFDSNAR